MSLIGPRPMILAEYDQIQARDRYGANDIQPGLTGWAQINGRDGLTVEQKARLDGWYDIHYVVISGGDRLDKMSPGKKGLVLLELIIELEQGDCPILIDRPRMISIISPSTLSCGGSLRIVKSGARLLSLLITPTLPLEPMPRKLSLLTRKAKVVRTPGASSNIAVGQLKTMRYLRVIRRDCRSLTATVFSSTPARFSMVARRR